MWGERPLIDACIICPDAFICRLPVGAQVLLVMPASCALMPSCILMWCPRSCSEACIICPQAAWCRAQGLQGLPSPRAEVVEYACGIAPELMGEMVENVSTGIDTYSLRQPLGVGRAWEAYGCLRSREGYSACGAACGCCDACTLYRAAWAFLRAQGEPEGLPCLLGCLSAALRSGYLLPAMHASPLWVAAVHPCACLSCTIRISFDHLPACLCMPPFGHPVLCRHLPL
jgi:hypothetical protein